MGFRCIDDEMNDLVRTKSLLEISDKFINKIIKPDPLNFQIMHASLRIASTNL